MSILLYVEGELAPTHSKQHRIYPLQIESHLDRLLVDFTYTPKNLDDEIAARNLLQDYLPFYYDQDVHKLIENYNQFLPLKNLLTISIDDTVGFRGAAHRHPNEQHIELSENEATQ